jgi:hypothetical protein
MIEGLGRFVAELRREGVDSSPAELVDAWRALERVGLEDRSRFRAALRATLAKAARQVEVFERVFDRFFIRPALGPGDRRGARGGGAGAGRERKARDLRDSRAGRPSREPPEHGRRPGHPRQSAPRPSPEASRQELARWIRFGAVAGTRGRRGRLRRIVLEPEPAVARAASRDHLRRDLTLRMTTAEEQELAREIPRLIAEIRLRGGRRRRPATRGRLWLRQVYRQSLGRGGVPFVLPFRRPRPRRARVVLLVDVSHSVARVAGFFLWLAAEFLRLDRRTRVLLFVDRPVDATRAVGDWMLGRVWGDSGPGGAPRDRRRPRAGDGLRPGGASFAELLRSLPSLNLDAPSDYGRALHRLLGPDLRPRGRDTILVVLGDGRTNRFDPLGWTMEEVARETRAVVWLVPEPRERWGRGDSALLSYLPSIDTLVESWNLRGLARGLRELLGRL